VNDLDGCLVSSDGCEEFRRFEYGANKESTDPQSDATSSVMISSDIK
jgi:hypothetical protein